MWEESFRDMNLPKESFAKLAFEDGNSKVYTEKTPASETEAPEVPTGARGGTRVVPRAHACMHVGTTTPAYCLEPPPPLHLACMPRSAPCPAPAPCTSASGAACGWK